ncbi:AAA family ATPase [Microbacterium esteraromaticum]|uniref:AAA family ATPase n=1 Tax=Microbacterium esteraromaticum TaxID=57043 RepID=UPI0023682D3B|nr:AAA family ATPase [Microbacterium esteraromaticum]WDH78248.1 AAA family ATPase [Microbacterium esteraromaticum]
MSKGGFVAFRGSPSVAVQYLAGQADELERSANKSSTYLASASTPFQFGAVTATGVEVDKISRSQFQSWAEHKDPVTGEHRGGKLRSRRMVKTSSETGEPEVVTGGTPLYQETCISTSKSLSLAAAANPQISEALEAAMERATIAAVEALQQHAVTRVGPAGEQEQLKLDKIEFSSVMHHTSRTADPHMHRHLQILSTGLVTLPDGRQAWRALDGAVLYRMAERVHAAADLVIASDAELRRVIAEQGFTWEPGEGGGRIAEFEQLTDEFSQRREQIASRRESVEAQWRAENPGREPSTALVRRWDNHSWSATRPEKRELAQAERVGQAQRLATVTPRNTSHDLVVHEAGEIDAKTIAADAIAALSSSRSAWSSADMRAAIDRRLAETYLFGGEGVAELQQRCLDAARREMVNLFDEGVDIEGSSHWTSKRVLQTDADVESSLQRRAQYLLAVDGEVKVDRGGFKLSDGQAAAARSITGTHRLVVVEGAAGSGKTTMLSAAHEQIVKDGGRMVAVSPTKRGALEVAAEVGIEGNSVHGMLVRAGATLDDRGRWREPTTWKPQPDAFAMDRRTTLVIDEAGMLDMATADILHRYSDATNARLVLLGDRKQLAAVGRGGYLTKAVHTATACHDLQDVRRFQTPSKKIDTEYADASLKLRQRQDADGFFDILEERGQVRVGEPDEVVSRVAETVALELQAGKTSLAIAATNTAAQRINHEVYERLVGAGIVRDATVRARLVAEGRVTDRRLWRRLEAKGAVGTSPEQRERLEQVLAKGQVQLGRARTIIGRDGDRISVGAKVATRQNNKKLRVANRQTFIVERVNLSGRVIVKDEHSGFRTTLPRKYARENLQLAYAVTGHGSQGMTVDTAHTVVSDQSDAAGVYVGLTRGRYANVLHAAAVDLDDARQQFTAAVEREGADLGLDEARRKLRVEAERLGVTPTDVPVELPIGSDRVRIKPEKDRTLASPDRVQTTRGRRPRSVGTVPLHQRDAELIVVVHAVRDNAAQVEFQLAHHADAAADMTGLNLFTEERDDLTRAGMQVLTREQFDRLVEAAGDNRASVRGKNVFAVRAGLLARRGGRSGYDVDPRAFAASDATPIATDVLDRQRQAEDDARARAAQRHEQIFASARTGSGDDHAFASVTDSRERATTQSRGR